MNCSIKVGKSPDCSEHSVGRRSTDEDEHVIVQYTIEATTKVEQFGNIVTSKTQELEPSSSSTPKLHKNFLLLLILICYI